MELHIDSLKERFSKVVCPCSLWQHLLLWLSKTWKQQQQQQQQKQQQKQTHLHLPTHPPTNHLHLHTPIPHTHTYSRDGVGVSGCMSLWGFILWVQRDILGIILCVYKNWTDILYYVKPTVSFREDCFGVPCLMQLLTWLYTWRIAMIFETMKEDSLSTNTLASSNCFVPETSSQMASALSLKFFIFCQKAQNFVYFLPYDFVQISPSRWSKYL